MATKKETRNVQERLSNMVYGASPVLSTVVAVLLIILGVLIVVHPGLLVWLVGLALVLCGVALLAASLRRTADHHAAR